MDSSTTFQYGMETMNERENRALLMTQKARDMPTMEFINSRANKASKYLAAYTHHHLQCLLALHAP